MDSLILGSTYLIKCDVYLTMKAQSLFAKLDALLIDLCLTLITSSVAFAADMFRTGAIIHFFLDEDTVVAMPPKDCPESKIGVCYGIVYVCQIRLGDRQYTT
jgi:hypothetical protein